MKSSAAVFVLSLLPPVILAALFTWMNPLTFYLLADGDVEKMPAGDYCCNADFTDPASGETFRLPSLVIRLEQGVCLESAYLPNNTLLYFGDGVFCKVGVPFTAIEKIAQKEWTVTLTDQKAKHPYYKTTHYCTPLYIIPLALGFALPALLWVIGFFKVIRPRVRRRVLSLEERR